MLKWVLRILYFVVVAILSLQVYGYAYFEQLGAYYDENMKDSINDPNELMEGMNTILGLSYFQETPDLYTYEVSEGDTQFRVTIKAVGAVTEGEGVDGYAIILSDLSYTKDAQIQDRTIMRMTVELDDDTFLVDGVKTNRKTLIYDSDNPFSFQNIPVFFVFDYEGYTYNETLDSYASMTRLELIYGSVDGDEYVFDDQLTFLATPTPNNEAARHKSSDLIIDQEDYHFMSSFTDNIPNDTDIETLGLNINRGDINDYNYVIYRIIAIYLVIVFIVTYFLFFHKSFLAYLRKRKDTKLTEALVKKETQAIFKDPPEET